MNPNAPAIEVIDPEMETIVAPDAAFEQIASGLNFTEGPVWIHDRRELLFSDIHNEPGAMYAWSPTTGLRTFRAPSDRANGNFLDNRGRLVTCEQRSRRVTRTEPDGTVTVLAERYQGKRLNAPNDLVVKKDDTIWFSDPPYGVEKKDRELDFCGLYRLDPGSNEPVLVARDMLHPNGLCFTADEQLLYVADSCKKNIKRYKVNGDNTLTPEGVFLEITPHVPDGIRLDGRGRLYSTAGDGVQVFRPDGTMIGKFLTPAVAANCLLVEALHCLFITATGSVWKINLK